MDIGRMRALLAVLQEARSAGVRSVNHVGRSINCGSDVELENAINDLKARIATATTGIPRN